MFYLFAFAAALQFGFLLLLFSRLAFLPHVKADFSKESEAPPVSIIVAARNEERNLKRLLPALLKQRLPKYEVIVVNDRSDDGTQCVIDEFQKEYPDILRSIAVKDTPQDVNPKKHALSLAIASAAFERLLLTDADCLPASDQWAASMSRKLNESTQIVLGYSPYEYRDGFLNAFIRYETFYTGVQYLSAALAGRPYMGVGRNLAYCKSIFEQTGGYGRDAHITGGDDDLFIGRAATSTNTSVVLDPASQTISLPEETWRDWLRQKRRHLSVSVRYKPLDQLWLGALGASHALFWISFLYLSLNAAFGTPNAFSFVVGVFFTRATIQTLLFQRIGRNLSERAARYGIMRFVVFDFLYFLYYCTIGPVGITTRNVTWKT